MSQLLDARRQALDNMTAEELECERIKQEILSSQQPPLHWWKPLQPFALLLTTALISGYLIPRINQSHQEHQKELQLKSDFVTEITTAVAQIMLAVQFAESGYAAQSQEEFDEAYQEWETQKLVVSGKLRTYFREPTIYEDWKSFSDMVSEVYALAGTSNENYRNDRIARLKEYFGDDAADWETLLAVELKKGDFQQFQKYYGAWFSLRDVVYRKKSELLQKLLNGKMSF